MHLFHHASTHFVAYALENYIFEHHVAVFEPARYGCRGGLEPAQEGLAAFVGNESVGAACEVEDAFVLEVGF